MKLIVFAFILITTTFALNCILYDYSQPTVACISTCPSSTTHLQNKCLTRNQYLINSQVHYCPGITSPDRNVCCQKQQFIQNNICFNCTGQIYNDGQACCSSDSYLDYSQTTPNCVRLSTGNCPTIAFNSLFKVCCSSQKLYNVATGQCQDTFGLNCDSSLFACCPNGKMLDYSQGQYICISDCSWKSSSSISTFRCEHQYCNNLGQNIPSSPPLFNSKLLSFSNTCCYGYDFLKNCITADKSCQISFANRGWSICCLPGQSYSVVNQTCVDDCTSGYILLGVLCVTTSQNLDLRQLTGIPREMSTSSLCNGVVLPVACPICCPYKFYIKDNKGCSFCNGNIFTLLGYQVCCPYDNYFNSTSKTCNFCDGILDASAQLCCPSNSYIHYDISGKASCSTDCSQDNLYNTKYCCDGMTQFCSYQYTATTCNYAYMIGQSCQGCPGFCSSNNQLCSSSSAIAMCNPVCDQNQLFVSGVGCLSCDSSCIGCTQPMNSSYCLACAFGYSLIDGRCQFCSVDCLTCSQSTDYCLSCNLANKQVPINGKCISFCLIAGYYLNTSAIQCSNCAQLCTQCLGSSSNSCTMCSSGFYLTSFPQGSCSLCSNECSSCYGTANQCIKCASGYYKNQDGTCSYNCIGVIYNLYNSGSLCLSCHQKCNGCTGHPQNCIQCSSTTTYLDTSMGINVCSNCVSPCQTCATLTNCISCIQGYFLSGFSCQKCDNSCLTCNGPSNSNCLSCFGSSNLSPDGFCSGCSSTCSVCSGNKCSQCISGYYMYNGNCVDSCPSQTYSSGKTCLGCDPTCLICNQTNCTTCQSNYIYFLGSKCYSVCPTNYTPNGKYCSPTSIYIPDKNTTDPTKPIIDPTNPKGQSQIIDQAIIIKQNQAYINMYFNNNDFLTNNVSVNLVNKITGSTIALVPTSSLFRSDNKLQFSVQIPSDQDFSSYSLIQTSTLGPNGATSTMVSSQSSNQLILNGLADNAFSNMKVLGYIFSAVMLIFVLLTKVKGHFTAEQANNIILHSFNFAQVCYLFKFATSLNEGGYFFLNGFGIAHLSFFPNFFAQLIPAFYIQNPVEKCLIPDGNLLRNSGFTFSFQLIILGLLIIAVIASLIYYRVNNTDEPPHFRKIMRIGILLFHIGFMNSLFFSFVQLIQPYTAQLDYKSFTNANVGFSYMIVFLIPLLMIGIIYHFYKTYNSDVLQHYYTLREASLLLLIYSQSLVMCLGVGKPLIGLFLIPLEIVWFIYNFQLYKYGDNIQLSNYKKYFGILGAICFAYVFLSLQQYINWVVVVIMVSISIIILLVYCGYQIVGIFYYNIFSQEKQRHEN